MKKIYVIPAVRSIKLDEASIIATSGEDGIDGQSLGNEFNESDVSYTKGEAGWATGW